MFLTQKEPKFRVFKLLCNYNIIIHYITIKYPILKRENTLIVNAKNLLTNYKPNSYLKLLEGLDDAKRSESMLYL